MNSQFQDKLTSLLSSYAYSPRSTLSSTTINSTPSKYMSTTGSLMSTSARNMVGRNEILNYEELLTKSRNDQRKKHLLSTKFDLKYKYIPNSKSSQKIKKKISFLTEECLNQTKPNSFIINNTLTYRSNNGGKIENNTNVKEENELFKNNKKNDEYLKTVTLFGNYKPVRRYFVSNLNKISGNFDNMKKKYEKKNYLTPLSKEEKKKIKENNDLQNFKMFLYQNVIKDEKDKRFTIKNF